MARKKFLLVFIMSQPGKSPPCGEDYATLLAATAQFRATLAEGTEAQARRQFQKGGTTHRPDSHVQADGVR